MSVKGRSSCAGVVGEREGISGEVRIESLSRSGTNDGEGQGGRGQQSAVLLFDKGANAVTRRCEQADPSPEMIDGT